MEVPMSTTRTGSAVRRVRALRDRTHLLLSPRVRSRPQAAEVAPAEHGSDSQAGSGRWWDRRGATMSSRPYLLVTATADCDLRHADHA